MKFTNALLEEFNKHIDVLDELPPNDAARVIFEECDKWVSTKVALSFSFYLSDKLIKPDYPISEDQYEELTLSVRKLMALIYKTAQEILSVRQVHHELFEHIIQDFITSDAFKIEVSV